jgi:hypothetical protein
MRELVPIVLSLSVAATILGIFYLRSRENIAMMEKGLNPRVRHSGSQVITILKYGLLLVGAGLGLLAAYMIDSNMSHKSVDPGDNPAIYFAMIAVGGGLGLIISFLVEKKWMDKNKQE